MYTIIGATGYTGRPIAEALLAAGKRIRIISRDPRKAKTLTDRGAKLFVGDPSDSDFLVRSFEGATAVYALMPTDLQAKDYLLHQQKIADAMSFAAMRTKIRHVVSLSCAGAQLERNLGVVASLRYMEQRFDAIPGLNTLHVRAAYFMENLLSQSRVVKDKGLLETSMRGDLRIHMIAAKDVAAFAAKRLLLLDFAGHNVQYLLGQRDLSYVEVAGILGKAIGRPELEYVQLAYTAYARSLQQLGASQSLADHMQAYIEAVNAGKVFDAVQRDPQNTTKTSIEEFASVYAHLFTGK